MKKLYRSTDNKIVAGILGGIAEYLEIDPVVIRLVFVLLACITGFLPGVIFYLIALFIIPNKGEATHTQASARTKTETTHTHESDPVYRDTETVETKE